jgi:methyl-accepting chemotaxis protein
MNIAQNNAMRSSSILTRLIALSVGSLAILATGLISYGLYSANETRSRIAGNLQPMAENAAEQRMKALAYQTVQPLQAVFQQGHDQALNLAEITLAFKPAGENPAPDQRRAQLNTMIKAIAKAGDRTMGAYLALEKNAFDNLDASFINNPAAIGNDSGRIAPYWERSDNGELTYTDSSEENINDATMQEGIPGNWWYQCPFKTGKACIIEPYTDEIGGEKILMASTVVPIIDKGRVIGISGADIKLNFLSELINQANESMFDGSGRILLLSSSGIIAADSGKTADLGSSGKNQLGKQYDMVSASLSARSVKITVDEQANQVWASIPFALTSDADNWVVVMQMPRDKLLADVDRVNNTLDEQRTRTVIGQIITGLVLVVAALFVAIIMLRRIITPLRHISRTVKDIAEGEGDLTKQLPVESRDEVGRLATNMNVFTDKLRQLIGQVKRSSDSVSGLAENASGMAKNNADSVLRQQHELDMVSTAVQEMAHAVQEIARSATQAAGAAKQARHSADDGRAIVNNAANQNRQLAVEMQSMRDVISQLEAQSGSIVSILDSIRGIADQTNLLALNAAIEAARAGETGRGFAVVADEVRTLAQRTQDSTVEIQQMVNAIVQQTQTAVSAASSGQKRVEESVALSTQAEQALLMITDSIGQISDMNIQIAAAVEEQTAVTEEVSRNITVISQVANDLADSASKASQTSGEMAKESRQLNTLVDRFKV